MDNLQNDYSIIFSHVQKAYGSNVVINDLNLNIRKGERLILLGPSGCGKTTTLRMIAGFEEITKGELKMDGRVLMISLPVSAILLWSSKAMHCSRI